MSDHGVHGGLADTMDGDGIFDFTAKLALYPDHVRAALADAPGLSLATVFMDLASESCNHNCTFCDGNMYPFAHARFTTERLLAMADEIVELGADSLIFAGEKSEPTVHPGFPAFAGRLYAKGIKLGIYTNGSILNPGVIDVLANFEFVRVSMDAGTAQTHRAIHRYPDRRNDFLTLLEFLGRVAVHRQVAVGTSFIVLPENVSELSLAAQLAKERGVSFFELKPMYGPGYSFDGDTFLTVLRTLESELDRARGLEDGSFRIVLNNQLRSFLAKRIGADELTTLSRPRPCITNRLRLVVSPRGCYLCTPLRGQLDKSIGNASTRSLVEIWYSSRHTALMHQPCKLRCTYHEQNELLLAMRAPGRASAPIEPAWLQRGFL